MLYKLIVTDNATELIRSLHPHLKKKVRSSLQTILSDPYSGKVLKDELSGLRSFRVSKFRIVYKVYGKQIEIVAVGPRKHIYEETFRLMKEERGK
ncbi:MAG: type II toxin-antitoxin system RelE/ParE family toxin [Deltaproteobacteria bacterium]|nr:type II toxin-antitoxin system RelE/ParE family toxin [Deltaproteobacteria bacterium]